MISKIDNGHLFLQERQEQIMKLLKKEHKLLVPYLCEYFSVSPATIRSDLNDLESKGLLVRTHGGALLNTKTGLEKNFSQKQGTYTKEKEVIAAAAAELVEDGDIIAIDTGTTTLAFAQAITGKHNLTVVTNDIKIALLLEEQSDANVVFVGGTLRRGFHCSVGPLAINCMKNLRVDKCFMGTNGLTKEGGLSTPDINQAEVKRQMIEIGAQVIVLCDSSKIGMNSFCTVAPLNEIGILITDSGLDKSILDQLEQLDVTVKTCEIG